MQLDTILCEFAAVESNPCDLDIDFFFGYSTRHFFAYWMFQCIHPADVESVEAD
jgi:hypothetical protein